MSIALPLITTAAANACRNRTDVCDGGFSKWAQITEGAVIGVGHEFGDLSSELLLSLHAGTARMCVTAGS